MKGEFEEEDEQNSADESFFKNRMKSEGRCSSIVPEIQADQIHQTLIMLQS